MNVFTLAIDDSSSDYSNSLTGTVLPLAKYQDVRREFYEFTCSFGEMPGIISRPIELHGAEILSCIPGATDAQKLSCFTKIVDLINNHGIEIYRVGYTKKSTVDLFASDNKLFGLNYMNLLSLVGSSLSSEMVLPIIDGLDEGGAKQFNQMGQSLAVVSNYEHLKSSSVINNCEMFLEPVFSSSKFSSLVQISDMVGYILHSIDCERINKATPFKSKIAAIGRNLKSESIKFNKIIELNSK